MMTTGPGLPEHVIRNRAHWDKLASNFVASGERAWRVAPGEEHWGISAFRRPTSTFCQTIWRGSMLSSLAVGPPMSPPG
jgi:hypothetical protein